MPNSAVFRRPFRKRGQNWPVPTLDRSVGSATGSGGVVIGGSAEVYYSSQVGSLVGSGGVEISGAATSQFIHGPQVASDIVIEWDLDNDGDFSESIENVTEFVRSVETFTGRDWPSLLTGKAGPGKFRASLRNDDDRFSYFNTGAPTNTSPFALRTGRKVRLRTSAAGDPDPSPIARDRFRRSMGALGSEEYGLSYTEPLTNDFTVFANRAVATSEGDPHMALVDAGTDDYYVQIKISVLGDSTPSNRVGTVYRYVDTSNYSLCVVNPVDGSVQLINVVSGVEEVSASFSVETYSGATIGVLVNGASATAYLEGVALASGSVPDNAAELVGFYAQWVIDDDRPEVDEFFVWSGIPTTQTGVLWTGHVSELTASVDPGPEKNASIAAEGALATLSSQEITPPSSLNGRPTGLLAGHALARALQIHPPGQIDLGDVTTGTFAMPERSALAVARDVEEVEFGFLYETQEGYLSFRDRSHRDESTSVVTFTDDITGKFHYHKIEPFDWNKEIFNRVLAGVSPWTEGDSAVLFTDPGPYTLSSGESQAIQATYEGTVVRYTGHTRDVTGPGGNPDGITSDDQTDWSPETFTVNLPATVDSGDLLLVIVVQWPDEGSGNGGFTSTPAGWTAVQVGSLDAVYAKVADGTEDGGTVVFGNANLDDVAWTAQVFRITDWIGDIAGVQAVPGVFGSGTQPNPPSVNFPWGPLPSLVIPYAWWPYDRDVSSVPSGYSNELFTENLDTGILGVDTGLVSAQKIVTGTGSENPGVFTLNSSVNQWRARTIAIQGPVVTATVTSSTPSGSEPSFEIAYDSGLGGTVQTHSNIQVTGIPLVEGDQTFAQADDYDSQDDHNAIRTYQAAASLFATPTDAQTYADLVLSKYADDRPIVSISFYANKSGAYRKQAYERRVGDRITLVANNNAGLGVNQDFFIESVNHKFSNGNRLWEVTWELSPA